MNGLMIMLRLKPVLATQTMALLWADLTWALHVIKVRLPPFYLSASRPASKNMLQAFLVSCSALAATQPDCHPLHMCKYGMLYWVVVLPDLAYLCPELSLTHSKMQPVYSRLQPGTGTL